MYITAYTKALKSSESSNPSFLYPLESHSSMQFTTTFIILATGLATLVGAAPADVKVRPLFIFISIDLGLTQAIIAQPNVAQPTPQANAHVFICTDYNYGGACTNYGVTKGQCSNLPSAYNDNISSLGPDNGLTCTFYLCVTRISDGAWCAR
jgi:hypothetical protein